MESNYKYRGDLARTTLPEILYTIDRFHVPGVIEARREDIVKRVHVQNGYIIHASSTDRRDSLGSYLLSAGTVPREELDEVLRERSQGQKRLGVMLVERGMLSPAQVLSALRRHIEAIVWGLFSWDQGEVVFGIGESPADDMVQIQLPIRQVIVEGVRQAPDAKRFLVRVGSKSTVLQPCFKSEDLIETGIDHGDLNILRSVDGKKTLLQLCSLGPKAPSDIAKTLYMFQVLHLVKRQEVAKPIQPAPDVKVRLGARSTKAEEGKD